jgi:hypothetical protein
MLLKRLETRKWREEFVYNKWLSTLPKNNKPCCVVDTHTKTKNENEMILVLSACLHVTSLL